MTKADEMTSTEASETSTATDTGTTTDTGPDTPRTGTTTSEDDAPATRTRTRSRTRTKTDDAGDAKDAGAKRDDTSGSDADGKGADRDDGNDDRDDDAGDGPRRRRRRGSRGGRGRRRSGESSSDGDDKSDDRDDRDGDDAGKDGSRSGSTRSSKSSKSSQGGSSKGGSSRGGSAKSSSSKSSSKGGAKGGSAKGGGKSSGSADADAKDGDSSGDGDEATRKAIAKGGTRMAAKRQRRSGGGGGGKGPRGVSEEVRRAILEGPPRTMLVTAREDRTQIAVLEDRRVVEHHVTHKDDVTYVGNIYMARVQNVLPGMEAAFLDIGKGRNGVLYAGEVLYDEQDLDDGEAPRIEDTLKNGQKVLVQVTKDPMGTKGPRLTQHLSLAGRYMVLAPNSDLFGISRKLTDKERDRLRRIVKKTKPEHHGIIVRTAAENATEEQLTADLERLLAKWEKVEEAAKDAKALTPVYEEPQLVVKVIRDNFGPEFEKCLVDSKDLYEEVRSYLEEVDPDLLDKVELYEQPQDEDKDKDKPASLFEAYNVNEQLRKAMDRKVWLPSGGYLIIETTEAMKVIDVNTGKFTGGKDASLEEVVLKTNLEAADEIVRQLRLRDMGGMIIIDFIDMLLKANQDQVVRRLKRELLRDRTKTRVSEVSRLGLVQMTRKNVSHGLVESFSHKCDHCNGTGRILDDLD